MHAKVALRLRTSLGAGFLIAFAACHDPSTGSDAAPPDDAAGDAVVAHDAAPDAASTDTPPDLLSDAAADAGAAPDGDPSGLACHAHANVADLVPIGCPIGGTCAGCPRPGAGGAVTDGVYVLKEIVLWASGCGGFPYRKYRMTVVVEGQRLDLVAEGTEVDPTRVSYTFTTKDDRLYLHPTCGKTQDFSTTYTALGDRLTLSGVGVSFYPGGDLLFVRRP